MTHTKEEIKKYHREWAKNKRSKLSPDEIEKLNKKARDKRKEKNKMGAYLEAFDLTGKRFGRLVVLKKSKIGTKYSAAKWLCRCDCGKEKEIFGGSLRKGLTTSCGCFRSEESGKRTKTHGDIHSKEYIAWASMKQRCYDIKSDSYINYGLIGTMVCERWLNSYENFLEDMGRCPSPELSLDRIKTYGNYEKDNCRWATSETQANNKRNNHLLTYDNQTMTIVQWTRKLNIGKWWFYNKKYKNNPEKVFEMFYKKNYN